MTERRSFRIPALAVAGFVLAGTSASAQVRYGTYDQPLEGQRYDTMRALAHYLDETAQDALQGATQDARYGTAAQRRVVTTVRAFARQLANIQIDCAAFFLGDVPHGADEKYHTGLYVR